MANQPTASHRVFHIPELLEQILLNLKDHLPALIGCIRVDKTFLNTIAGSTLLQQALYFKSSPNCVNGTGGAFGKNWLLSTKKHEKRLGRGGCISVGNIFSKVPGVHGTLVRLYYTCSVFEPRLYYAEASWRRMYLTKEDLTVGLVQVIGCGCGTKQLFGEWMNPTMGELVDAVMP
ncbi:hypothetical protein HII31_02042 [Pseudocercospora fuligena]|uniref:Uncharacterized protein n=1 Tax=Pseudocercospora fuligena TaxID=685502 RepID=A0A8H6RTP1_9PEZI|nr:hypothetical protein HII31_02042 [Pseudocercospora fuligena]